MDKFLDFGSDEACHIMEHMGSASYENTCLGLDNGAAYHQAGITFWLIVLMLFVAFLFGTQRAIGSAFR